MPTLNHFARSERALGGRFFRTGVKCYLRNGMEVCTIAEDRTNGRYAAFLISGDHAEFPTFAEAEAWAWQKAQGRMALVG